MPLIFLAWVSCQDEVKDVWFNLVAEMIDNTVPDLVPAHISSRNAHASLHPGVITTSALAAHESHECPPFCFPTFAAIFARRRLMCSV